MGDATTTRLNKCQTCQASASPALEVCLDLTLMKDSYLLGRQVCKTRNLEECCSLNMHASSVRAALASAFHIPLRPSLQNGIPASARPVLKASPPNSTSTFSTSAAQAARKGGGGRPDRRISKSTAFTDIIVAVPQTCSLSSGRGRSHSMDFPSQFFDVVFLL